MNMNESQSLFPRSEPEVIAFFDGSCEPKNPGGVAAYGVVVFKKGVELVRFAEVYTPPAGVVTTNNLAEYAGLLRLLDYLEQNPETSGQPTEIRGDSKLVIEQMWGTWGMNKGTYLPLAKKAKERLSHLPNITGRWIPREENSLADSLSMQFVYGSK